MNRLERRTQSTCIENLLPVTTCTWLRPRYQFCTLRYNIPIREAILLAKIFTCWFLYSREFRLVPWCESCGVFILRIGERSVGYVRSIRYMEIVGWCVSLNRKLNRARLRHSHQHCITTMQRKAYWWNTHYCTTVYHRCSWSLSVLITNIPPGITDINIGRPSTYVWFT